ncbi:hypothetical protein PYCC9005_003452 [Savitreella phatthalungensis]
MWWLLVLTGASRIVAGVTSTRSCVADGQNYSFDTASVLDGHTFVAVQVPSGFPFPQMKNTKAGDVSEIVFQRVLKSQQPAPPILIGVPALVHAGRTGSDYAIRWQFTAWQNLTATADVVRPPTWQACD